MVIQNVYHNSYYPSCKQISITAIQGYVPVYQYYWFNVMLLQW
jgi:hypothetical protein